MTKVISRIATIVGSTLVALILTPGAAMAECGKVTYQAGGAEDPCHGAAILAITIGDGVALGLAIAVTIASYMAGAISQSAFTSTIAAITDEALSDAPTATRGSGAAAVQPAPPTSVTAGTQSGTTASTQLALPSGRASQSLGQLRAMKDPGRRWQAGEDWIREMYGGGEETHYPVSPNDDADFPVQARGGRFVDAPVALPGGGTLGVEVKMYGQYRTVTVASGGKVTQKVEVPLSDSIREQINKDVALRSQDASFDPRWTFPGAGPSPALREYLTRARIVFVEYD